MFALGLAAIPFFNGLYSEWIIASINLPQMKSASPVIIFAKNRNDMPHSGASGPDSQGSFEIINTLGTNSSFL